MIQKALSKRISPSQAAPAESPLISLFAVPKPFTGHVAVIQRNAIRSWGQLEGVEIVLFGESQELLEIAEEVGATVFPVATNQRGTPCLSGAFEKIHAVAKGRLIAYVNSDILVDGDFVTAAQTLTEADLGSFLAIGRRIDLRVDGELEFVSAKPLGEIFRRAASEGSTCSIVCKDYFLFTRDLYQKIPNLLVGRGNWDNWMVHHAKGLGVPVVDLTRAVSVVHQSHDYSHLAGGRRNAYLFGPEARHNQRAGGGRHLISGSTANWQLTSTGPVRRRFPRLAMVWDLPRFLTLVRNLLFLEYIFLVSTLQLPG